MTTVIAVYNSDGCVGRCDAKCHFARSPECNCICGGRLHGTKGQAIERNTRDVLGDDVIDALRAFADRNGYDVDDLYVEFSEAQQVLTL